MGRALLLVIRAKLEAVGAGITSIEQECQGRWDIGPVGCRCSG